MQVVVVGASEVRAKLAELPGNLRQGLQGAAPEAADAEAQEIRSETPRLTGTLAGSIQTSVTATAQGVISKVFTDERYGPFVERGTRQHGPGRHMFERGSQAARQRVEDRFRQATDEVAARF